MLSTLSVGVPDSKIARETTDLARQVYPPFLFNHCLRTFWLADRLAADGLRFDREIVYIAAMLHDIGVLQPYDHGRWFEVDGAQAARDFLAGLIYPTEKVEVVWDAIALHTTTQIAAYKAPEVALINLGAAADAIGLRIADLDPNFVRELIEELPRLDFPNKWRQILVEYMKRKPSRVVSPFFENIRQTVGLFTKNPLDAA
ncbi:MAG: HD domain-containing protein [Gammaproteobacteria bacterium]